MFLNRDIQKIMARYKTFPAIAILGPRQSGKTTLAKHVFQKHAFVSLENPAMREFATKDPEKFLNTHANKYGIVIDEFQYVPNILSYIKILIDEKRRPGYFVLTGSQNYLMNAAITQSLAGRVGILTLLPFSYKEILKNKLVKNLTDKILFDGCYPGIYTSRSTPFDFYQSYVHTYVERDMRQLAHVEDLLTFQKFMQLCAGRTGQLLNIDDLATTCGIPRTTANGWLSALQASYIIFLLRPYFNNFNKRLVKTPKLYFYDTGLACTLLGLRSAQAINLSPFRGPLFETAIISDLYKQCYNMGTTPPLYFWRDRNGRIEVDCLVDVNNQLTAIEIKSGHTINEDYFHAIKLFKEIAPKNTTKAYVVYAGDGEQQRTVAHVMGWQAARTLVSKILVS